MNNPQNLKCIATLLCDLLLITIRVSDCHQFSDFNISQDSVATDFSYGRLSNFDYLVNFENMSIFSKVGVKSIYNGTNFLIHNLHIL